MDINQKAVNTIRVICAEGIDKAKSGHPGICLGSAPIVYTLFNEHLTFNPDNPHFENRDRFVLSAGHGSMLLYTTLHMFGYKVSASDLQSFRQLDSLTPGHPEYGLTDGVEISTGPLGQGIANAVGMAMAEAHLSAHFNRKGFDVVDHYTYALCGDGCLMEGISSEACSLAGTLKLGKLILLYDKNNITIEGSTDIAFTEDVATRFEGMHWQVLEVKDGNDLAEISQAIKLAKQDKSRPSIIICNTVIGYGSPLQGTNKVHGSPLGQENTNELRKNLCYDEPPFTVADDVRKHVEKAVLRGAKQEENWNKLFAEYQKAYPELAKEYRDWQSGNFDTVNEKLDELVFDKPEATRITGFRCINAVASAVPSLFGGSADLNPSNKTNMTERNYFSHDDYDGSNVHFGIREHAMAAICNGLAVHGGIKPYCSTFFVFSDYMKGAMRVSAIMNAPVVYILTHDSIGVGEDGPTHEPIEQLASLRSTPSMVVYRPADGKEATVAYADAFTRKGPTAIVLTRQDLPQLGYKGNDVSKGGYVLEDCDGTPDVILIASGSEVQLAVGAKKVLAEKGIKARVVSMLSMEVFDRQSESYRQSVLPSSVRARVAVEAGNGDVWYKYVGLDGKVIAMHEFGASAPYAKLFPKYGFTVENVVDKALETLKK